MGILVALGVGIGYVFISIPNVELVSAVIFISGWIMGIEEGIVIGCLTEAIYSAFNPYGIAAPPLFIAQVISMGFTGFLGGWTGKRKHPRALLRHITMGMAGFISTLVFAVLTTLSFVLFIEPSMTTLIGSFLYGMGFYLIHIASNTLIFLVLVPVVIDHLAKAGWTSSAAREARV